MKEKDHFLWSLSGTRTHDKTAKKTISKDMATITMKLSKDKTINTSQKQQKESPYLHIDHANPDISSKMQCHRF